MTVIDARTLNVSVFDPELVKYVDKAIREGGLDLNPQVNGTNIKVPIPKTTTEQRQKYAKQAAGLAENAKVRGESHHSRRGRCSDVNVDVMRAGPS